MGNGWGRLIIVFFSLSFLQEMLLDLREMGQMPGLGDFTVPCECTVVIFAENSVFPYNSINSGNIRSHLVVSLFHNIPERI